MKIDKRFKSLDYTDAELTEMFKNTPSFRDLPIKILDILMLYLQKKYWYCVKCNAFHPYKYMKKPATTKGSYKLYLKSIDERTTATNMATYLSCPAWRADIIYLILREPMSAFSCYNRTADNQQALDLFMENFHSASFGKFMLPEIFPCPYRLQMVFGTFIMDFVGEDLQIKSIDPAGENVIQIQNIYEFAELYYIGEKFTVNKHFPYLYNAKGIWITSNLHRENLRQSPSSALNVIR